MKIYKLLTVVFVALALFISACGAQDTETDTAADTAQDQTTQSETAKPETPKEEPTEAPKEEPTAAPQEEPKEETKDEGDGHYPLTFQNCGFDVTLDKAPERVIMMTTSPVVALDEIDVFDTIIATAGDFPEAYYTDELNAKIAEVPSLSDTMTTTGGVVMSLETILEAEPDFIFGYETETITRDGLAKAGIELYIDPGVCRTGTSPLADFKNIYSTIEQYGQIFNKEEAAAEYVAELKTRVDAVTATPAMPEGSKAAALYVESDGGKIWTYGPKSMTHPQMEALGARNIFEEFTEERVFDVSIEELIDQDPDMLILLYGDPELSEQDVIDMLLDMPGADKISAVKNGQAFPHLFNFSEPATPLVVDGMYLLRDRLGAATPPPAKAGHYPYTFDNCGVEVTLDKAPERIVLLNSAPVVALDELGLIDRVISRGGEFPEAYYSDSLNKKLADIDALTSNTDSSGHLVISLETVLETEPDLVFASESETITRDALEKAGAVMFTDPSFCKSGSKSDVSFDNIYSTIETYGEMFDVQKVAHDYIDELEKRVGSDDVEPALPEGTRAAALYVESDGGKIWAYGPKSMTHPQMVSLGATNVFEDLDERVVDVSIEELIDRDPEMLILLHGDPEHSDQDVLDMFLAMPGADKISAVKKDQAFPHLFNFSEPATPLVIEGVDMLRERIGD